jgi:hypothetical protein
MKFPLIASAAVLALAYATPGMAASSDVCPANYDPVFCPAHPAVKATPVDRKRAHRLLEARASHAKVAKLAHAHPHVASHDTAAHDSALRIKLAAHPEPAPRPIEFRVATLDDRRPSLSCEGSAASVLCPGYQLLGIAY